MRKSSTFEIVIRVFLFCLVAFTLCASRATAQVVKGSISGSVVDQSGGAVPGAEVRATNKDTGQGSTTMTQVSGTFQLALLPVGTYSVQVSKPGFKKIALSSVEVNAGQDTGLGSLKLEVGQVTTTVEVSAAPPLLETTQAQVTTSIKGSFLTVFPGVGENQGLDNLALQLPGVVNNRDLGFSNFNGTGFSVNGLRGRNNDQQIDGQNNNDNSVAGPALFVSNPEFVQEYQITTNNFGPEYGRNSGSVVNIITKSGTNNWHGTVFGTESNSALNSLSNTQKAFQGLKKVPRFNEEFTGGTVGGPLQKDRVFLFGGFDDDILSQRRVFSTGNLTPTPTGLGQLASCFPGSASVAALQQFGPYGIGGGNPTSSGNLTNRTLRIFPAGDPCVVQFAGIQRTLSSPLHEYDWVTRLDVNGVKNRVYGRYIFQKQNSINGDPFVTAAAGYPSSVPDFNQQVGLSWTRTISARVVNEARVSYGRLQVEFGGNGIGNTIPGQAAIGSALARINMPSGFLSFGPATNAPQGRIVNTYQVQDNLSYVRGKHQIKAGLNYTYQRSPNIFLPNFNGQFIFRTVGAFDGFSLFAANRPQSVSIALGTPSLDFREHDSFFYVGDDYKVKPNLTLNLGLTYSYFGQPANLFNRLDVQRESNASTAFFNPNLPLSVRTFPELSSPKNNWGPSVGFAYTPQWGSWLTGGGKTVLRGGYRLTYDPAFYNIYLNIATAAPQVLLQTLTGANAVANPLPARPFGPAVRSELAPFLTLGVSDPRSFNETTVTPDFRSDRTHSWSFGIQREFTPHAVFEARYVGNHGSNLFESINQNPRISQLLPTFANVIPSGLTPCPAANAVVPSAVGRINCNLGVVRERTNTAVSDYNGLQTEFRATNLAHQLTLRTAYTWSKTTDNASEIFGTFAGGGTTAFSQNPLDFLGAEHGPSGLNIPQNWTLSFYEEIPTFRDQHGIVGHILGGWGIAGSYIISSGQPYTPVQIGLNNTYADAAFLGGFNSGVENLRPFLSNPNAPVTAVGIFAGDAGVTSVPSNTLLSFNAFNAATSAVQTVTNSAVRFIVNGPTADAIFGTPYGNAGRNILRDYQTNVGNFALYKNFKFSERVRLEWRMTLENVFNHPNFFSIDPFLDDVENNAQENGFGVPSLFSGSTLGRHSFGQRAIHFGLKVTW